MPARRPVAIAWRGVTGSARSAAWLAERAERVTAGNSILTESRSRFSDSVVVIPLLLEMGRIPARHHEEREAIVLGWIGSRTTAPYLDAIRGALAAAARALTLVRPRLSCEASRRSSSAWALETHSWGEAAELAALQRMDIGSCRFQTTSAPEESVDTGRSSTWPRVSL